MSRLIEYYYHHDNGQGWGTQKYTRQEITNDTAEWWYNEMKDKHPSLIVTKIIELGDK